MTGYTKGIFGGFLAVLAAFGWVAAILFLLMFTGVLSGAVFVRGFPAWILLGLIIAGGFYLGFRAAYDSKSSTARTRHSAFNR
jgi:hypothetical protein